MDRRFDVVALSFQHFREDLANRGFVVDNQHACHGINRRMDRLDEALVKQSANDLADRKDHVSGPVLIAPWAAEVEAG